MIHFNENEYILSVSRKHWWILFSKLIVVVFLLFVPIIIFIFWNILSAKTEILSEDILAKISSFIYLLTSLYYLFIWLYFCIVFVDYYLDIWVVTNMRIVDIEQRGLFNREVSECYISKIEDVAVETKGLMATFLNYGDLHVQTASEKREFIFKEVNNPNKIKNIILQEYNKQHSTANN